MSYFEQAACIRPPQSPLGSWLHAGRADSINECTVQSSAHAILFGGLCEVSRRFCTLFG